MAEAATGKETHRFEAEVKQLLHLVIHSLYSNKEIFLRELISNASDACDKLRFESLTQTELLGEDSDLRVRIAFDGEARTIDVADNGIGMSREEVIEHIGTIARSGTREFLQALGEREEADMNLIGQFGVGFYSAFVVADRVSVTTRRAGSDAAVRWESAGTGDYTLEPAERERGTTVTLHLREGEDEFLDAGRLRHVIKQYSDHISFPVQLRAGEDGEYETVNRASALWRRPRQEIDEQEYREFYKHVAHDFDDPLAWAHNRVEGKLEYTSLLYVPGRAPFDLWDRDSRRGIKLFVQRVFIMEDSASLMPRYLRFVRGVIDSNDLPLNVSRELLQSSRVVDSIRAGCVKRVLGLLEDLAKNQPDVYATFWQQFGPVLKEGPGEDFANAQRIAALLRFASIEAGEEQTLSLAAYVGAMAPQQKHIYYLTADSYAQAAGSPHLEIFRERGIDVLLLSDRVDEFLVGTLPEFEGKPLKSVARGGLDEEEIAGEAGEDEAAQVRETAHRELVARVRSVLGDGVSDVRLSQRLTTSPSCIVAAEGALSGHLERLLREAGQEVPGGEKPVLELNPRHPIVEMLGNESDKERFNELCHLLHGQAVLAEGGSLDDPASFVRRLNEVILSLSPK